MSEIATQELARARAARIRAGIGAYLHTLADIAAAYQQRDWLSLGYADWQAYVDGEYSETRLRLTPEHRQKAVAELRLAGMSTRAIAGALGVNRETVMKDARQVAGNQPPVIQGADGKMYAATHPTDHPSATGEESSPDSAAPLSGWTRRTQDDASEAPAGIRPSVGAGETAADATIPVGGCDSEALSSKRADDADAAPGPATIPAGPGGNPAVARLAELEAIRQQHAEFRRNLDAVPPETKRYVDELGRRISPVTAIEHGCQHLLNSVRGVDPERAVADAPDQLRHHLDVVHEALSFLTRVADAMNPKEYAA